jgi:hypothetical protein
MPTPLVVPVAGVEVNGTWDIVGSDVVWTPGPEWSNVQPITAISTGPGVWTSFRDPFPNPTEDDKPRMNGTAAPLDAATPDTTASSAPPGPGISFENSGSTVRPPAPVTEGSSCGPYNQAFIVPKYDDKGVLIPVTAEELKPTLDTPSYLHPVTACKLRCDEIAKAKHEECKVRVKQFTEFMKKEGCPGTWCSTKKKSVCPKGSRSSSSKYSSGAKSGSGCATGYCGR